VIIAVVANELFPLVRGAHCSVLLIYHGDVRDGMGLMGTVGAFRKEVPMPLAILENLTTWVHALHLKISRGTRINGETVVGKGHATEPTEKFVLGTAGPFVGL
jgi:hypothetical protein